MAVGWNDEVLESYEFKVFVKFCKVIVLIKIARGLDREEFVVVLDDHGVTAYDIVHEVDEVSVWKHEGAATEEVYWCGV